MRAGDGRCGRWRIVTAVVIASVGLAGCGIRTDRIRSDCHRCTVPGPTLVDQLEARGISWAAYMEGLPRPCSEVPGSGAYTDAVDPFMHARTVRDDVRSCCAGLGEGGLVPTIVVGPRVPSGRDSTPYTHYALLRSIEAAFGLPFLGHAGDAGTATIPAVVGTPRRARLCIPEATTCRTPPMPGA